jgi:putative peptidoglycan lipid II flippase
VSDDSASQPRRLAHDALLVTCCTLFSRTTGFLRVLVAAAVLSNGVLGDTYHAANFVPNLVFELVAGGVLQAVLLPTFVASRRSGGDDELGRTAGVVLGAIVSVLALIALVMMMLAPLVARALVSSETDPAAAHDKVALITAMLLVFIPQIVFYGIGMVATAALAARRRFAAAALAPAVNNTIVIACYLLYAATRHGAPPSLHLDALQFALLAGGTTLAVVVFTAVPGIVLSAQGVRWRPRWDPRHPAILSLRRIAGWAMLSVVGTLLPTAAAVVLGYRAEGGVAVFTMAFAFFVLPHALVAVPVATTVAPRVAEAWQSDDVDTIRQLVNGAAQVVVPLLMFAGTAMVVLSWPVARVAASIGDAASQGYAPIAHTVAVFGIGLVGYGMAFVGARVLFALNDVKRTSLLVSASACVGVVAMVIASGLIRAAERSVALAVGYVIAQVVSAALLTLRVRSVTGAPTLASIGRLSLRSLTAALLCACVMVPIRLQFGTDASSSLVAIVVAGIAGGIVFIGAVALLLGSSPRTMLRQIGRV